MATTISGTTITFNDASTQTTNVPNATAALSAGGIGTYALLAYPGNPVARSEGFTIAGTSLKYAQTNADVGSATSPPGSWRLMGALVTYPTGPKTSGMGTTSVWLRYA